MQFSAAAVLALVGAAVASPALVTVRTSTTRVVTITSCAPTVTLCPAASTRVVTTTVPVTITYAATATGGAAYATGAVAAGCPGNCPAGAASTVYNVPTLTGYKGPSYTGAAGQIKAAGALAGVGAVAALLL